MNYPDNPPVQLDAVLHAVCILEALEGDWETALENLQVYVDWYGIDYALRLQFCLTPRGTA